MNYGKSENTETKFLAIEANAAVHTSVLNGHIE